ncbi:hypothetical protein [Alkalimarinus sediminis]|uniref:Uncharacterized protein n=1 Tax=Alkalimarinus sediminis TaxID=1632866 RepID=A0A9E8HHC7_9ALTE|nr:hypothetical protein [Alkalimarinus sediminis]UZW74439.1 hypothetical protein NNL22_15650 [Alkalimarinus sediminis]
MMDIDALKLNIEKGSLLGYEVGQQVPTEAHSQNITNFDYGYAVYVLGSVISAIFICFMTDYEGFKSYKGSICFSGKEFHLEQNTSFDEVASIFGEPVEEWNDGVERCAEFLVNGRTVGFIWCVDGKLALKHLSIEIA